jgi:hypothetical protein
MTTLKIIEATPQEDFTIDILFSDGVRKRVDIFPHLDTSLYHRLREPDYFKSFIIDQGGQRLFWREFGEAFEISMLYVTGEQLN